MEAISKPEIDKNLLRLPVNIKRLFGLGKLSTYDAIGLMGNTINASAEEVNNATDWIEKNGGILAENEAERISNEEERIAKERARRELDDKIQEALDGAYEKAEADREERFVEKEHTRQTFFDEAEEKRNAGVILATEKSIEAAESADASAESAEESAQSAADSERHLSSIRQEIEQMQTMETTDPALVAKVAANAAAITQMEEKEIDISMEEYQALVETGAVDITKDYYIFEEE